MFGKNFEPNDLTDNLFVPGSITQKTVSKRVSSVRFFSFFPVVFSGTFFLLSILRGINFKPEKKPIEYFETNNFFVAERGVIFDSKGVQLVSNTPNYQLLIDPKIFPNSKEEQFSILTKLDSEFDISDSELERIKKKLSLNHAEKIVVKNTISSEDFLKKRSVIKNIPGILFEQVPFRNYEFGSLFSHIVGYTGALSEKELREYKFLRGVSSGKTGLEKSFNEILSPTLGVKNSDGEIVEESISGKNLHLTVDAKFQEKVRIALQKGLKSAKKQKGVAVVINPQTGEVLAMVSLPDFSLDYFSSNKSNDQEALQKIFNDKNSPQLNRAISGSYPPGSTFKPIIAVAGLSENIISENTIFNDTGSIKVDDKLFYGWNKSGLGKIDVKEALAQSSNPFFYTLAGGILAQGHEFNGLGYEKIRFYLEKFLIDKPTGIDLPFEFSGFIPTPEWKKENFNQDWFSGDTVQMGIGQGFILLSPLKLATSLSVIVNNGYNINPYVVKKITDQNGNLILETNFSKTRVENLDSKNLQIVREGMKRAVYGNRGTAKILANLPFEVGAKTGTAESPPDDPHAWGVAFGPYENPEIMVVVLIENGGEGSKFAMPVIKEIMMEWWKNK